MGMENKFNQASGGGSNLEAMNRKKIENIKIGRSEFAFSEKGGMLHGWKIDGQDVVPMFHQKEGGTSYRGGAPVCFPFFGPTPTRVEGIKNGEDAIGQHGWLRNENLTGEILETGVDDSNKDLTNEKAPQAQKIIFSGERQADEKYAWSLKYQINYKISETAVEVSLTIERGGDDNDSDAPINPALHPYFAILNNGQTKVDGVDPEFSTEDYGMEIKDDSEIIISTKAGLVKMETAGFGKLWVWSDNSEEYGCLEPVANSPEEFNTELGTFLKKGETKVFKMQISLMEAS